MITYILKTHPEYPQRLNYNNYFYIEYKNKRPFFIHQNLIDYHNYCKSNDNCNNQKCNNQKCNNFISENEKVETLNPTFDDLKDKYTYITNDYLLNSVYFEFCEYFINENDSEISTAILPVNPFGPTGIGGRGLLNKWGANYINHSIFIHYNEFEQIFELLTFYNKTNDSFTLPTNDVNDSNYNYSSNIIKELMENTDLIFNDNQQKLIYTGYLNDSRNTDHAWVETAVFYFYINNNHRKFLIDTIKKYNAENAYLIDINQHHIQFKKLDVNHKEFINYALQIIYQNDEINETTENNQDF